MSNSYLFRGKPISGPHAVALLKAIAMVNEDAPNPTMEDIESLFNITVEFGKKFEEDLRSHYQDPSSKEEALEWLGDE